MRIYLTEIAPLPHDPQLTGGQVLQAYVRRMNHTYMVITDPARWPAEAERLRRSAWAPRTAGRRCQVLGDLMLQRAWGYWGPILAWLRWLRLC
jgi:hypothetical protein